MATRYLPVGYKSCGKKAFRFHAEDPNHIKNIRTLKTNQDNMSMNKAPFPENLAELMNSNNTATWPARWIRLLMIIKAHKPRFGEGILESIFCQGSSHTVQCLVMKSSIMTLTLLQHSPGDHVKCHMVLGGHGKLWIANR
ncbi:hypothetical protein DPMN_193316 [Dreissena polymorpha]|uniref:Uncharacterized protein n=1 Tax=Dreissena polymorpha TaxID=45954 RepID=A0A9D3Y4C0_DREPO|nr:hypothetical protein DPMN_193316 [Dreissena polymorpha]